MMFFHCLFICLLTFLRFEVPSKRCPNTRFSRRVIHTHRFVREVRRKNKTLRNYFFSPFLFSPCLKFLLFRSVCLLSFQSLLLIFVVLPTFPHPTETQTKK
ncbi:hypothetical protein, unlikely [Trypanosoma brucei gambiense DAL972]|uniref:T. brucei spp.-specific protein n=1 Tax=Trypanosoma brucei gambiense (strain MHOM/CI/86/DAL972) TaxID=679716 RepID=C9ZTI7_TRYB9|nr:hypothetical protein, unlikely [Trypanosoma brucei gambiense DAL972]CBH12722.1 hypothetical protein, unlikely [Trypanosoma brucei gambiense DAL972]|eukprot:XP_011775002.1 hypothetical protein, unlikely [Trypanosoma brucei gambiense DAL972]